MSRRLLGKIAGFGLDANPGQMPFFGHDPSEPNPCIVVKRDLLPWCPETEAVEALVVCDTGHGQADVTRFTFCHVDQPAENGEVVGQVQSLAPFPAEGLTAYFFAVAP